jgi:hypothetical protein
MLILVYLVVELAEYNMKHELALHIAKISLELISFFLDAIFREAENIKSFSFCEILRVLYSDSQIAKIEFLHLT